MKRTETTNKRDVTIDGGKKTTTIKQADWFTFWATAIPSIRTWVETIQEFKAVLFISSSFGSQNDQSAFSWSM